MGLDRGVADNAVAHADRAMQRLGSAEVVSSFLKARDGLHLHLLRWSKTRSRPRAVLVFLHGIASHAGWFGETASDLMSRDVVVYAPDRRGSGRSGGRRGHLDDYVQAIDDVDRVIQLAGSEHREVPVFLAGSSWAAKLAIVYAAVRPAQLSGLLLLGPGLFPRVNLSPARRVAVGLGHLVTPTVPIRIPLTPELYTATPRYLEFIRADRLRLSAVTAQFFWQTARLDRRREQASARLRLPLLVQQGEADPMMDVAATQRWYSALDVPDKTYRAYAGASHTLDFEPDPTRYLADMLEWLSARVPPGSPDPTRRP